MDKNEKLIIGAIVFVLLAVVAINYRSCISDMSGNTTTHAYAEATTWANSLYPGETQRIACQNSDTDNNGYVTCTARIGERASMAIECVIPLSFNSGCRMVMPGLQNLGQAQ